MSNERFKNQITESASNVRRIRNRVTGPCTRGNSGIGGMRSSTCSMVALAISDMGGLLGFEGGQTIP